VNYDDKAKRTTCCAEGSWIRGGGLDTQGPWESEASYDDGLFEWVSRGKCKRTRESKLTRFEVVHTKRFFTSEYESLGAGDVNSYTARRARDRQEQVGRQSVAENRNMGMTKTWGVAAQSQWAAIQAGSST